MTGLETLRQHHLAAARTSAEKLLRDAQGQAAAIRAKAAGDAASLLEQARTEGEAAADLDTRRQWTAARRRARSIVLAAQKKAYDDLRESLARAIRGDARYPDLLRRLEREARQRLGPGTAVEVDTEGTRGLTATRKDRRIDWSLDAIVDAGIARSGAALEEVWR